MTRIAQLALAVMWLGACAGCDNRPASREPANDVTHTDAAKRIVTLSPHLAELVFAVGAGELLVGVSAYTDFPESAAALPLVGDSFNVDHEQLTLLEPDLLLSWSSGTPAHVVDDLRTRGFRVETIRTVGLADVAAALRRIGTLTGHDQQAQAAARAFEEGIRQLQEADAGSAPIDVFYQVDARPLYTINGAHYVSELIAICGGVNIFADLGGLAPLVSFESVLERNPEVILASSDAGAGVFDAWRRWHDMAASRYGNFFLMPANEIGRATPRLLTAAGAVCSALQTARRNRESYAND